MVIFKKAKDNQIERLVEISKAAFDTDIEVGASEVGGPPDYDCMKWHRQMCKSGNLYVLMKDEAIVGGAIIFEDEKDVDIVYVGRIFVDPLQYHKGYGKEIMQQIEKVDARKHIFRLETPVWNQRTNSFYPKCGYEEMYRDEESVYYQKVLG